MNIDKLKAAGYTQETLASILPLVHRNKSTEVYVNSRKGTAIRLAELFMEASKNSQILILSLNEVSSEFLFDDLISSCDEGYIQSTRIEPYRRIVDKAGRSWNFLYQKDTSCNMCGQSADVVLISLN